MKAKHFFINICLLSAICGCNRRSLTDGVHQIDIFATNDVHGRYFDSLYVGNQTKSSLLAVNEYMNGVRSRLGAENVVLLDAGDNLQGDNASYYFNFVDTDSRHLFVRMAEYMKYDAITVGNHDIETGHEVYDRIKDDIRIPYLAANAVRTTDGKAYFQEYAIMEKGGLKVAVIGFTNANMKSWLAPEIWKGIDFKDLTACAQEVIDRVIAKENPQVVIVSTHTGTGKGDGSILESQGLDLLQSLRGVDFLLCSHDHRPCVEKAGDCILLNAGSRCSHLAHGTLKVTVKNGKVTGKETEGELIELDKAAVDTAMRTAFRADYEAVRKFTLQKVGELGMPLSIRESYFGPCDYMRLIHQVCLNATGAELCFAAPLKFDGTIESGELVYNDMFTIYPYENQLYVLRMKGRQIKDYLEYSYDRWIRTVKSDKDHALNIVSRDDPRTGTTGWSFASASYNFDSMSGASYTVDLSSEKGERIEISTLADGRDFDPEADYTVAMTSYRASGGGDILREGAGIDSEEAEKLTVERYPEIRQLIYNFFSEHLDSLGNITPVSSSELDRPEILGSWRFIPEDIAGPALERDRQLLFAR